MQNHVEKAKSTKEKEGEKKMKEKMLKKVLVNNSIFIKRLFDFGYTCGIIKDI